MAATGSAVLVTVFETTQQAEQAMADLRRDRLGEPQLIGAANAPAGAEVAQVLVGQGVPEGQARWYASESEAGRALVLLVADGGADEARTILLRHGGYDVGSRGGELAGGDAQRAAAATAAPPPSDVTDRWEDVWTRYEMLFGQRYGAGDVTWDQYQPAYRWAWEAATSREHQGRTWAEVEPRLRSAWEQSRPAPRWADVAEGMRDVWDDVAQEIGTLAEGGASAKTRKPVV